MSTHWSPDQTADHPTVGVCGKPGMITMHFGGTYAPLKGRKDACSACCVIAERGYPYPPIGERVSALRPFAGQQALFTEAQ